jgi:nitrous-oxide reductase
MHRTRIRPWLAVPLTAAGLVLAACKVEAPEGGGERTADVEQAALATYVAPGQIDEYYLFYSGGHSGQVFVAGVPSMRHIATIPVFTPYPGTGYGFDEETKAMLGGYTWGDVHHPAASETDGEHDGRWLFVNDNANNRLARIDLRTMKTGQILGPIPNSMGNHASGFITPNTEYALVASRFSTALPKGTYVPVEQYATSYKGMVSGIRIDPETGEMSYGWQVVTPPFNWDLGDAGRGPSEGWAFFTSYNSERATGKLEVTSTKNDRDYMGFVNWKAAEQAIAAGRGEELDGVQVLDPAEVPGVLYLVPIAKSPHGSDVSPDGKWIVAGGKLSPTATVFSFEKFLKAVEAEDFSGEEDGIPVVRYEAVREAEVQAGLGPLHTTFDDKGFAYTSLFVESAVSKWRVGPPWDVVDKIPVQYNIGHLIAADGDSRSPDGRYLIAMNKQSKGRHLNTGPSQPESSQLIDISGEKMLMLYEAFTEPEPHFAELLRADLIQPIEVHPKEENEHPHAIWTPGGAKVERTGPAAVEATVFAMRTFFSPAVIEVEQGDTLTVHITNGEQSRDEIHGFGVAEYNVNLVMDPGETKTVKLVADKTGVYPFYCTNFCSALHQEMQGYLAVKPRGYQEPPGEAPARDRTQPPGLDGDDDEDDVDDESEDHALAH